MSKVGVTKTEGDRRLPPVPSYMPGRDGRMDHVLPTFVDFEGCWGYNIPSISHGLLSCVFNFCLFPQRFTGKEQGKPELSDLAVLAERNYMDNKRRCNGLKDWDVLHGTEDGETLVVASCGPSLTYSLPWLYKNREKYKLLCLNRSLRAFNAPGMKPDYYYFVERRGLAEWCHDVDPQGVVHEPLDLSDIMCITTPQADPRVVACFDPGLTFFSFTGLAPLGHHPDVHRLSRLDVKLSSTIGNVPYLAWKLGFKKIVFVGCDFSVEAEARQGPDGKFAAHVGRVYFDKPLGGMQPPPPWSQQLSGQLGHDGKVHMVGSLMQGMCDSLAAALDFVHYDGGVECINATPRGMLRFNNMTLEEAFDANRA